MLRLVKSFFVGLGLTLFLAGCGGGDSPSFDDSQAAVVEDPHGSSGRSLSGAVGAAKTLYDNLCISCHGNEGIGATGGGELYQCKVCDDVDALHQTILTSMPVQNPASCGADCSRLLANYIFSDFTDVDGDGESQNSNEGFPVANARDSTNLAGIAPLTVNFNAAASSDDNGNIVEWLWQVADGQELSGEQVQHTYTTPGIYRVILSVTDNDGLSASESFVVNVYAPMQNAAPVAVAKADSVRGTAPYAIHFDASDSKDDQGIAAYYWDFGDGQNTTGAQVAHTYNVVGQHTVVLNVIDTAGLSSSASIQVTIDAPLMNSAPRVTFTASPNGGEAPVLVQFDASASSDDGTINRYDWDFGDGSKSVGKTISHNYSSAGNYTVRLIATDDGGLASSLTRTINITAPANNAAPVAIATLSQRNGLAPLNVVFNSSASTDDGVISSYLWRFGDNSTSTEANPTHVYSQAGVYAGSLTVTDAQGLSGTTAFTVVAQNETELAAGIYQTQCASCHGLNGLGVGNNPALTIGRSLAAQREKVLTMPPNIGLQCEGVDDCATIMARYVLKQFARVNTAPVANASGSSNISGNAPLNVRFDGGASTDDFGIKTYRWNFGDGTTGSGVTVNHIYGAVGNYSATLTVFDEEGLTASATVAVTVIQAQQNQAPIAAIQASTTRSEANQSLSFDGSGSADDKQVVSWNWNFGDGSTATGSQVSHSYSAAGNYNVTLTVADVAGLQNSANVVINIIPPITDVAVLFKERCAGCHGVYGQGDEGPSLTTPPASRNALYTDIGSMLDGTGSSMLDGPISCSSVANCRNALTDYVLDHIVINPEDGFFACSVTNNTRSKDIVRRLSVEQLMNSYRTVLTHLRDESVANNLVGWYRDALGRDMHDSGFHHMDQSIFENRTNTTLGFALDASEWIWLNSTAVSRLTGGTTCSLNDRPCRVAAMQNGVDLILRRPATQEEIDFYANISNGRMFLAALFMSPAFLYHAEYMGNLNSDPNVGVDLTPYETASRLSFLFWNTTPDRVLLDAAASGQITNNYEAVVNSVINDPRTRQNLGHFYEGWLRYEEVFHPNEYREGGYETTFLNTDYAGTGDTRLPGINQGDTTPFDDYRKNAIDEIKALTDFYTFNDGTLSDLFTSQFSFAKGRLAKAYGLSEEWNPSNGNPDDAPLVLLPQAERSGVLTRAALLMSNRVKTRPIIKGVKIRKDILCDEIPPPADNSAPPAAVVEPHYTSRQVTAAITEIPNTSCSDCHLERINPLGFATEEYDSLGRYRNFEVIMQPWGELRFTPAISASVMVNIDGATVPINGGVQLSEMIATSPKVDACFARKVFRFSFARFENLQLDGCLLNTLAQTADQQSLIEVFRQVSLHPDFRRRTLNGN